ncbi:MAG: prepilin-type N-terminal cleavage/methylation domain-containing protein [Proteobacteria bacterium]|nr:MAG: prepilin-type N-terminal cleavage/methylation domain-containing protein [Pseudomonadota bacterium]
MNAKILRSQKGFTLIELMIVVGIIGILVAIAAPNFSRYQSKARQSEAKIALSAIYAAEKSFFSEYSAYVGSLDAIGYSPEGNKRYYATGFSGTGGTTSVNGFGGSNTATPMFNRVNAPTPWNNACNNTMLTGWVASGTDPANFIAGATGQIREGVACDQWTINENKVLVNSAVVL